MNSDKRDPNSDSKIDAEMDAYPYIPYESKLFKKCIEKVEPGRGTTHTSAMPALKPRFPDRREDVR